MARKRFLYTILAIAAIIALFTTITVYKQEKIQKIQEIKGGSISTNTEDAAKDLPESSTIRQAALLAKNAADKQRAEEKKRLDEEKNIKAAEVISNGLMLYYFNGGNSPTNHIPSSGVIRLKTDKYDNYNHNKFAPEVFALYPKCMNDEDRMYVEQTCIYTAFILDRVPRNKELFGALALARDAGIQIVLTYADNNEPGSLYKSTNTRGTPQIWINILTTDQAIIDYLTKDASK
ncbi:MAG: hypothetical protein HYW90_01945 [Candidatus Sungbacteria bacterium]|nr:hypothetical protein [Candidatus Sungbacteria bacterium]